ncbi:MAG TPA: hypothetical protein VFU37_04580 [Pyrinomonadaceae bacterium]|nr:hypothetical protein [Pyrinomonadaceae bacterium]
MRSRKSRSVFLLCFWLITISLTAPFALSQQPSSSASKAEVVRVVVFDSDMASLLGALAESYDVTIGFETVPQHPNPRVKFQVYDATRNQVFDAIVRAVPEYQWRERDGVIEFLPVAGASFLDTPIGTLKVTNADWLQAIDALLNLPDVRASMLALGLSRRPVKQESAQTGRPINFELTNATVRDALNNITAQSGLHFWVSQQAKGELSFNHSDFR